MCYVCAEYSTEYVDVVLHKSASGFGMTMSGYNPVSIQAVQLGNLVIMCFVDVCNR